MKVFFSLILLCSSLIFAEKLYSNLTEEEILRLDKISENIRCPKCDYGNINSSNAPISKDLTRNQERFDLPIMGSKQSWDNPWDVLAMSNYNTISALSESPVKEGLVYAGTDDGFINVTDNDLSLIHISEPTRLLSIAYAVLGV